MASTAPDWLAAPVVGATLRDGQLTIEDATALLQEALTGRDARQAWIIRNGPHVVEYHEINRTLANVDLDLATAQAAESISFEI